MCLMHQAALLAADATPSNDRELLESNFEPLHFSSSPERNRLLALPLSFSPLALPCPQ